MLAAIGEQFEEPDVVGVVLSVRAKEVVLSVWNMHHQKNTARLLIGERLRAALGLGSDQIFEYKPHATSIKDRSTFNNGKQYLFVARGSPEGEGTGKGKGKGRGRSPAK
eukprot:TRINITY_DN334_c0_g1_i6.p2 TRINITY_DN334_c0_g1~~TRINITY_DN334_c0_g1_i6.p2  ORF type:complete len:109 (+),score=14.44 TRINITY_DN334_c0_g1_i6:340-666(+)